MKINAFMMRYEIWKGRKKKFGKRWDRTTGRSLQKDNDTRFTICTTGADVSVDSAVLLLVLPVPWLTDVSSSQRWVIYSQTIYITFTFMHLADAFIQSDLHCIQVTVLHLISSQTNGAVSNYTYLFRFVWFVLVFSDLLFCFRICRCVFWLVIMFSGLLLCFLNCYFVF